MEKLNFIVKHFLQVAIHNIGGRMKKNIIFYILAITLLTVTGCATKINPFSPNKKINNNGEVNELISNQNGLITEIGKLKQDVSVMNSQLSEIQSGLLNINSAISRNENSGIQILQGDGSLMLVFGTIMVIIIAFYRNKSIKTNKQLSVLTKAIVDYNDSYLNEKVLRIAKDEGEEKEVLKIMKDLFNK